VNENSLLTVQVPLSWKHALERHVHKDERTLSGEARLALSRHLEEINPKQFQRALSGAPKEAR
jgi:hypothetical protein